MQNAVICLMASGSGDLEHDTLRPERHARRVKRTSVSEKRPNSASSAIEWESTRGPAGLRKEEDALPRQSGSESTGAGGTPLFNEVVMVHLDLVYRMALRMTGRQHEAEDALQETFLRAHRAFDRFDLRDHGAKAWLLKILHNVVITRRQQAGRRPTLLEDMDFDSFAAELENEPLPRLADGQLDWDHFDDDVKHAIEELIPEYREVILLWGLGGISYKEISDIIDVPIGTVMSRLYRARQVLMQKLGRYAAERGLTMEKPDP